jgi:hypothetical protein
MTIPPFYPWFIVRQDPETGALSLSFDETGATLSEVQELFQQIQEDEVQREFWEKYAPAVKFARCRIEVIEEVDLDEETETRKRIRLRGFEG